MSSAIRDSDEFAFTRAAPAECLSDDPQQESDEPSWDTDPETVLERLELATGVNCYGQPIN
jgi:hypothetical protein